MSSITIRNLDPSVKERLRLRAAQHGRSMEAEARQILKNVLDTAGASRGQNLYEKIRARIDPMGGVDLDLPARESAREPSCFE